MKRFNVILKCLYDEIYTVKNSKDFVDFVSTKKVLPNEQIVSFDVVSLFTSIPVDFALKIVREELNNTNDWMAQTNLTVDQICNLLAFVLNNSFFVFKGAHYVKDKSRNPIHYLREWTCTEPAGRGAVHSLK